MSILDNFTLFRALPRFGPGVRQYGKGISRIPASINRHTGKPHEHRREIARRLRQQGETTNA